MNVVKLVFHFLWLRFLWNPKETLSWATNSYLHLQHRRKPWSFLCVSMFMNHIIWLLLQSCRGLALPVRLFVTVLCHRVPWPEAALPKGPIAINMAGTVYFYDYSESLNILFYYLMIFLLKLHWLKNVYTGMLCFHKTMHWQE